METGFCPGVGKLRQQIHQFLKVLAGQAVHVHPDFEGNEQHFPFGAGNIEFVHFGGHADGCLDFLA